MTELINWKKHLATAYRKLRAIDHIDLATIAALVTAFIIGYTFFNWSWWVSLLFAFGVVLSIVVVALVVIFIYKVFQRVIDYLDDKSGFGK